MPRAPLILALALAFAAVPAPALANGRYPSTTSVTFQPGDNKKIFVGTTFGFVLSNDDGATFHWVCEEAVGYPKTVIWDPDYLVTSTGAILATLSHGLQVSRDGACSFRSAPAPLAGQWVSGLAMGSDNVIWAITATSKEPNDVYTSHDDAVTFGSAGLRRDVTFWKTLKVAPSDPMRVYVSGYQMGPQSEAGPGNPTPLLYRTEDGGKTWTPLPLSGGQVFLLGVSATDPNLVFAQGDMTPTPLLRSTDGGMSWSTVLTEQDTYTSFVALPDGKTFLAGTRFKGVHVSKDSGMTWGDATQSPQMNCAGLRSDGQVFSCASNWDPDFFALGRSTDGGQTWNKVFRFVNLNGPLDCPAGTTEHDTCVGDWQSLANMFAIAPDAGPRIDAGRPPLNGGGGSSCGCGVGLALIIVFPLLPRRRYPGRTKGVRPGEEG